MQKQSSLKFLVVLFSVCVLSAPIISAKKQHKSGGQATTRSPPPTQGAPAPAPAPAPNNDAAKLSYGGQHSPPQPNHNQPPPSYQQSQAAQPPPYSPHPQPQPGYQPQPGGFQQPGPQPIIVNHVPQQQSSGGLGTAGGLALGEFIFSLFPFIDKSD